MTEELEGQTEDPKMVPYDLPPMNEGGTMADAEGMETLDKPEIFDPTPAIDEPLVCAVSSTA